MHALRVQHVVAKYRKKLHEMGVCGISADTTMHTCDKSLAYCFDILDEIDAYVRGGDMPKALQWLGFVQGCFFILKVYTSTEITEHNRSPHDTP